VLSPHTGSFHLYITGECFALPFSTKSSHFATALPLLLSPSFLSQKRSTEIQLQNPYIPSITLKETGEVVVADLVVAADGIHSVGVEAILGHRYPSRPQKLYNGCYRFLIPHNEIESDPETAWFTKDSGCMRAFMNNPGESRFVSYPCRG